MATVSTLMATTALAISGGFNKAVKYLQSAATIMAGYRELERKESAVLLVFRLVRTATRRNPGRCISFQVPYLEEVGEKPPANFFDLCGWRLCKEMLLQKGTKPDSTYAAAAGAERPIARSSAAGPDICGASAVAKNDTVGPERVERPIVSAKIAVATPNCIPIRKTWMTVVPNTVRTGA